MTVVLPNRNLESPNPPSAELGTFILETERLILRRHKASDAAALAAAANHREVWDNLRDRMPHPYTLADAEEFLARRAAVGTTYPTHVGVFLKPGVGFNTSSEPLLIGAVGANQGTDVEYRTWELGYWYVPSSWGHGYATEAAGAFIPWMFKTWPRLNRVEANILAGNEKSASVVTKCGFIKEGVRRGHNEKNGVILDTLMFAMVRSDIGALS